MRAEASLLELRRRPFFRWRPEDSIEDEIEDPEGAAGLRRASFAGKKERRVSSGFGFISPPKAAGADRRMRRWSRDEVRLSLNSLLLGDASREREKRGTALGLAKPLRLCVGRTASRGSQALRQGKVEPHSTSESQPRVSVHFICRLFPRRRSVWLFGGLVGCGCTRRSCPRCGASATCSSKTSSGISRSTFLFERNNFRCWRVFARAAWRLLRSPEVLLRMRDGDVSQSLSSQNKEAI